MISGIGRAVSGTALERPARAVFSKAKYLRGSPRERKNARDDAALQRLIHGLADDACCIDIGANVGLILGAMVEGCPAGQHIAFEPVPSLNRALVETFPGVDVRAVALGNAPGRLSFTVVPDLPSRSGLSATLDLTVDLPTEIVTVDVQTLDDALPADYHPTLIKVDVEGGELEALQGAQRTLAVHRPIVAVEHQYGTVRAPERTSAIFDLLHAHGYEVRTMTGELLDNVQFQLAVDEVREWNFVASVP